MIFVGGFPSGSPINAPAAFLLGRFQATRSASTQQVILSQLLSSPAPLECPLWAKSGHSLLFNHFVGADE